MSALGSKRSYGSRFQNADNVFFDSSVCPQSKRQKQLQANQVAPPRTPNNAVFDRALWEQQFCNISWDRLGPLFLEKSSAPSNGNTAAPSTSMASASTSLDQTLSLPAESYTSLCTDQIGSSKTTDDIDEILRTSSDFNLSTQDLTSFPVQRHIEQFTNDLNLQGNEHAVRIPRQQDQPWDPLFPNSQPIPCFQSNNRLSFTRPNSVNVGLTAGLTARGQLGKARSEIGPLESTYASWDMQNHSPEIRPTCTIPFSTNVQPSSNDCFGPGLFTDSSMLVNDGIGKQPSSTNYVSREDWGSVSTADNASVMPDLGPEPPLADGQPQGPPWCCSRCDVPPFKNQSESKKHWLRHMKPYRCNVTGCQRREGFSTRNDLDRHRKSLHKIATRNKTDKTYRCAAPNCNKKAKIWPRLDNFRQHCARTHRDLPTDELVKQSEYPKPGQRCVSRTQRNNEDTPTPAPFQTPPDMSSSTSALNTDSLLSSSRATEGHGNDTNNLSDEKSLVSAAPSAACNISRYSPHALKGSLLDPKDLSNTFVPYLPAMSRGSGLETGSSSVPHKPMLSNGGLVSDRVRLDQYTIPVSRSSSYNTACRSTHPLLVDQRLQGGYHAGGSHSLPNWYSYHRARDTSLEELETRYLKILQERSRPSKYEASLAPIAPASQGFTNEILEDALPSMDLSRTASQEAKKITHEVATSGLLSSQGSQFLQLKLQESLQRSLESLEDHYQDNLQRALASLNPQNKDGEVRGRESENEKIAIDEAQHKCLKCDKVKKTHSDLKKHVLRHSRPYTCTDENCQLAFGSKNDWKRHERTIHDDPSLKEAFWCALRFDSIKDMSNHDKVMTSLDIEAIIDRSFDGMPQDPVAWGDQRCLEPDVPNTERCQFFVWKKYDFYEHLYTKHGIVKPVLSSPPLPSLSSSPHPPQQISICDPPKPSSEPPSHYTAAKKARKEVKMQCHVGRNGTNGFWCGFCNCVVTINRKLRGAPAWDARYKHIDEFHFREVGARYFEEATRGEWIGGRREQKPAREASQADQNKQGEEEQPWLPRKKGDLWVVLGSGKTKGRSRYEEEKQERDKVEHDSAYDESGEDDDNDIDLHDIAPHNDNSETAAQHGGENEAAAATHTTTIPDQTTPSNITHPSTERQAAHPDLPPPEHQKQPPSTLPTSTHHNNHPPNEVSSNAISPPPHVNTIGPPRQPPPLNESILDEDYIANLGTTTTTTTTTHHHTPLSPPPPPPPHDTLIQQPQQHQQQRSRHTRSTASAAGGKLRWWRCHICGDGPWDTKRDTLDLCGNVECVHQRCKKCWGEVRN